MRNRLEQQSLEYLYKALLSLETEEECEAFLEDLCTVQELRALSQRMQVARLLHQQKVYNEIVAETGASTATISRVNRCLHYGRDGYKLVLEKLGN
ncbi:MAG: YerC/YecD family TrpR-related protein [Oscillospiraceae bacterium]|jgi:TrpR-related protein YerC/YecD